MRSRLRASAPHHSRPQHRLPRLTHNGRALDEASRARLEGTLGCDLSRVRLHDDHETITAVAALGARAFTLGRDIFLGPEAARETGMARQRTLAHEAAHSAQQSFAEMSHGAVDLVENPSAEREARSAAHLSPARVAVRQRVPVGVQRDVDTTTRLAQTHESLFVAAPSGGGLRPWQDPTSTDAGTAAFIARQAREAVLALVRDHPESVGGSIPTNTTESDLDTDAVTIDARIRTRFPFVGTVSATSLTAAVSVMGPAITSDTDYLRQWLANKLIGWTDIEQFDIDETDPRFTAMLDSILADSAIDSHLRVLATRQGGFQRGEGTSREIFIHRGVGADARRVVLIHELTHFHAHPRYREWVDTTTEPRFFNEGFTEWLAQKVMTDDERAGRTSYADRVAAIETNVAAHVPENDIARAYFLGEVWRIESRSTIARREFAATTGLAADDTRAEESAHARAGPGIVQEVMAGRRYRFMNLGQAQPDPKPEHVTGFRAIKSEHLDPAPALTVRFVGHASTPGTTAFNLDLSRRRAVAFYRMARNEGLPASRLPDQSRPTHFGESTPTVTEEDPQTRAFNRRVEMFVDNAAAASGASSTPPATDREPE